MKKYFDILLIVFLSLIFIFIKMTQQGDAQSTSSIPNTEVLTNMESPNTLPLLNNMLRQQANYTSNLQSYFNALSNAPNGSILLYNSNNVGIGTFSQGSAGQFLESQGAAAQPIWSNLSWVPNNIQVFVVSGTWTKPANVSKAYVRVIGAGGNGGTASTTAFGGGGGSGGYSEGVIAVTGNVSVTIGSTNSFAGSTTIQATAGSVGGNASGSTPGLGGAGGVGSGGSLNATGSYGGTGGIASVSGIGAASNMGGNSPGVAAGSGSTGMNGVAYGGGGSGGNTQSGFTAGGTGDPGAVIVYY